MNKLATLLLFVLVAVTVAEDLTFDNAAAQLGVKFASEAEKKYRQAVYKANMKSIQDHNANPNSTHKKGFNLFTLWTRAEFISKLLRTIPPQGVRLSAPTPVVGWNPKIKDWSTNKNIVTKVKYQGQCGSCWAFSAVAALESLSYQAYKIKADLSEQHLVDCSSAYGNGGCSGGWLAHAYNYVNDNGIATEASYPYIEADGTCLYPTSNLFQISGYVDVYPYTCDAVAAAVFKRPLSVAVDASNWSDYSSGIFSDCDSNINHGVLLVGVNKTIWKIKNSWSTSWGEKGFMRLDATGGSNTCGIC